MQLAVLNSDSIRHSKEASRVQAKYALLCDVIGKAAAFGDINPAYVLGRNTTVTAALGLPRGTVGHTPPPWAGTVGP